jgi:hypothetical protein
MDVTGTVALILSLFMPAVIIIIAIVVQYHKKRKYYESLNKALELGKSAEEIKEIFAIEKQQPERNGVGYLRGGVIVTGIGVGIAAIAAIVGESDAFSGAAFVFVLGLSLIAVYLLTGKKVKK